MARNLHVALRSSPFRDRGERRVPDQRFARERGHAPGDREIVRPEVHPGRERRRSLVVQNGHREGRFRQSGRCQPTACFFHARQESCPSPLLRMPLLLLKHHVIDQCLTVGVEMGHRRALHAHGVRRSPEARHVSRVCSPRDRPSGLLRPGRPARLQDVPHLASQGLAQHVVARLHGAEPRRGPQAHALGRALSRGLR